MKKPKDLKGEDVTFSAHRISGCSDSIRIEISREYWEDDNEASLDREDAIQLIDMNYAHASKPKTTGPCYQAPLVDSTSAAKCDLSWGRCVRDITEVQRGDV